MLKQIMRHDLRLLAADKLLWIIAAIFLVLITAGIYNGANWTTARKTSVAALEQKGLDALQKQKAEVAEYETGAKPLPSATPAVFLVSGKAAPVVLPPAPLAAVSIGQSDIYPYSASVDIMTEKNDLFQEYEQDNPLNLLAGRLDLAFVFVFIFPLLILAISYNLLSAEKENGTLQLSMANAAVSIQKIAAGKILTRLLIILALSIGFSLIGLALSGVNFADSETLARLGLWISAIAAYALFWLAAAILVNSFGLSSATNATVLGGIWIFVAVIMPSLLNVAATTLHPVPSRLEFVSKIREADNQTRSAGEKLLQTYYGDHPELAPPGGMSQSQATQRFYAIRQERQKRLLPEVERFETQLAAQQNLISNYRILSPAVVMQESLNDIAGTSTERQKSFVAQIREFVGVWHNVLIPKLMRRETLKATDYDNLPRFDFREESTAIIANRLSIGILLLLIPAVLLGILAFARLRRFSVVG